MFTLPSSLIIFRPLLGPEVLSPRFLLYHKSSSSSQQYNVFQEKASTLGQGAKVRAQGAAPSPGSALPSSGHLCGLGFPRSSSPAPGLTPTPFLTSSQSPPLPPSSIPFLFVPLPQLPPLWWRGAAVSAPRSSGLGWAAVQLLTALSLPALTPPRVHACLLPPHLLVRDAAGCALTEPASLVPFPSLVKTPCQ